MALEFKLDTLDGLDDGVKALYTEQESGGFHLDVTGTPLPQETLALKEALETERKRSKGLKAFQTLEMSVADIAAMRDANKKTTEEIAIKKGDFEAIRKQDTEKWEGERKVLEDENASMRKIEREAVIQHRLISALAAVGFNEEGLALLPTTLSARIKIETVDGNRETRIYQANGETLMAGTGKDGTATFADLAQSVATQFPSLVKGQGSGGGGKPPNATGSGASKTLLRSEFDKLGPVAQAQVFKDAITVVD